VLYRAENLPDVQALRHVERRIGDRLGVPDALRGEIFEHFEDEALSPVFSARRRNQKIPEDVAGGKR